MNRTEIELAVVSAEPTPADLLRGAASYVEVYGWHQGALYDRRSDAAAPPACTVGAIYMTGCGIPVAAIDTLALTDPRGRIHDALRAFAGHLGDVEGCVELEELHDQLVAYEATIGDWNDAGGRTLAQVTAALREAAQEWDRLHPQGVGS